MTEQMKFIVKEINVTLGRNYDLIKFDALEEKQLLQLLVDLLAYFNAGEMLDITLEESDTVSVRLLEMLSNVKYRPPSAVDPAAFRSQLLAGDSRTIHHVLYWLLTNKDQVKNTAYLARWHSLGFAALFLRSLISIREFSTKEAPYVMVKLLSYLYVPSVAKMYQINKQVGADFKKNTGSNYAHWSKVPEIPPDVARNNTIQDLLELYHNLIDEFKDVHKRTRHLQKESAAEIINDIKEMAVERDIVIKRLENVQVHLTDVNNKEELLHESKLLRLQQERATELEAQYETQQTQLKTASEQLKRYLNVIHGQSAAPRTANDVIKHLQEEIPLNRYLVKEKLPQETSNLQKELNIMQTVTMEQHPTRSDLNVVQDKISKVNGEIEQLVQQRLATSGSQEDKLAPFRQQASVIRRNKESSATHVHELAATLKEHEATLADLQSEVKQLLGDMVLRGEELKKYVNSLRSKSTVYKRQRANLSSFKVEAGILTRTLQILSTSDPTIEMALLNNRKMKIDDDETQKVSLEQTDLTKKSFHDLSQLVAQTAQKLSQVRQELQPLADKIKPIKQEFQSIQQMYEQKKRVYEATSINISSQMEPLKNLVKELTDQLNSKEDEWKNLRQKITKAESLQEVVMFEMKNSMQSPRKPSKMETLKKKIFDLEEIVGHLEEEQRAISSRQGAVEEQTRLWQNTLQLLRCKLKTRSEPAPRQGRMHITQHSQMLTLT